MIMRCYMMKYDDHAVPLRTTKVTSTRGCQPLYSTELTK